MHRLDTQKTRRLSTCTWDEHSPDVHYIQVKKTDKNAEWGEYTFFEAIVTLNRDRHRRTRRVWTPFAGDKRTNQALRLKWPEDKQARVQRKLRDGSGGWFEDPWDGKKFFMVTEGVDVNGRLFWREVIPKGELTEEEDFLCWDEWMREEGHYAEIERHMAKHMA